MAEKVLTMLELPWE